MTKPVHCTLTIRMHLEVTDPDALLTWAAGEVTWRTDDRPASHQQQTRALVQDVPGALGWAYSADPDFHPPGVRLLTAAVAAQ